jgi:hypothetical protein
MNDLESAVEAAWETRASLAPQTASAEVREAIDQVIRELDGAGCASPKSATAAGRRING